MAKQIIVDVSPTGDVKVETRGYVGKSCKDATKQLEAALGMVEGETLKAEYHQTASVENRA